MKNIPNLIISSGDPAGIGLDLCVFLAFKKFKADITVIGNKNAINSRAKLYKKNIVFSEKKGIHSGKGELKVLDVQYKIL